MSFLIRHKNESVPNKMKLFNQIFCKKIEGVYTLPVLAVIWLLITSKYGII